MKLSYRFGATDWGGCMPKCVSNLESVHPPPRFHHSTQELYVGRYYLQFRVSLVPFHLQTVWRPLRHVGVIPLFLHILQLLPITSTKKKKKKKNLCCISESMMKHPQKSDRELDLLWFSYGYQNCMISVILCLREYVLPIFYTYEMWITS